MTGKIYESASTCDIPKNDWMALQTVQNSTKQQVCSDIHKFYRD